MFVIINLYINLIGIHVKVRITETLSKRKSSFSFTIFSFNGCLR